MFRMSNEMSWNSVPAQLVSIIIPVFNGENFLREAIDSALAQTYSPIEVIVVNDGSTDNTEQICLGYGDRIRYYFKQNGGVATALNFGIGRMNGEYFAWLSHDDVYYPTKTEVQVKMLTENPCANVVIGNFDFWNSDDGSKRLYDVETQFDQKYLPHGLAFAFFGVVHACAMLIRRKHIDDVGLIDESLLTTQDTEWIFRLLRDQDPLISRAPLTAARSHDMQGRRTVGGHVEERAETHIRLINEVSPYKIRDVFGSELEFFLSMATFLRNDNNYIACGYVKKKIKSYDVPEELRKTTQELVEKLVHVGRGNSVVIYGAGLCGQTAQQELSDRKIRVSFFADKDQRLQGTHINGIQVIDPKDISKVQTSIIVALARYDLCTEVVSNLRSHGHKSVLSIGELEPIFQDIHTID